MRARDSAQGIRFVGEHQDGLPHGHGRLYGPTGKLIYEGRFHKGKQVGVGKHFVDESDDSSFIHSESNREQGKRHIQPQQPCDADSVWRD